MKKQRAQRRMRRKLPWDMPLEINPGVARVTLIGSERAYVENHDGLLECARTRMRFLSGKREIVLVGQDLLVDTDGAGGALITGRIFSVALTKGEADGAGIV